MEAALLLLLSLASSFKLDKLPGSVRFLYINIGANVDPVLSPKANSSIASVVFEPIAHSKIDPSPNLYVVPAAVAATSGLAMMGLYNENQFQSSSLTKPKPEEMRRTNWAKHYHPAVVIPVIAMSEVLDSVPDWIQVWYLKTDMQGHDFSAIAGASCTQLRRVHYMKIETYLDGYDAYEGVQNQFCANLLPHLLDSGFVPIGIGAARFACEAGMTTAQDNAQLAAGAWRFCSKDDGSTKETASSMKRAAIHWHEADVFFRRNDTALPPPVEAKVLASAAVDRLKGRNHTRREDWVIFKDCNALPAR